jgi:hypothetical protein
MGEIFVKPNSNLGPYGHAIQLHQHMMMKVWQQFYLMFQIFLEI